MKTSLIAILIAFLSCVSYGQNTPYSFFIAGHTYGAPGIHNDGLHPPFVNQFDSINNNPLIQFGVLTGDIVISAKAEKWDAVDAQLDSLLNVPVYFALGNHDTNNDTIYEDRYGDTYFSFKYDSDLFIILNPNINGWNILDDQLHFLDTTLSNNAQSVNHIFVFTHQVLWKSHEDELFIHIYINSNEGKADSVNFWTEVAPLFEQLDNEVILMEGDVGTKWASKITYDKYNNMTFITSGMGGSDKDNYVVINVDSSKAISYDVICLNDTSNCLGDITDHLVVNYQDSTITDTSEQDTSQQFIQEVMAGTSESFIYPNPATNELNFSLNRGDHLVIYSINGQTYYELYEEQEMIKTIDISHFQSGTYIVMKRNSQQQDQRQLLFVNDIN